MKVGIVIGHNSRDKGARATTPISAAEFDYNSELADIMDDEAVRLGIDAKIFRRVARSSYKDEIEEVYRKTDTWGAQLTIELHFNAYNGRIRGTETLAGPSSDSLRTAMEIHKSVIALYSRDYTADRGVKSYRSGMRGALSLISGRAPAVLVEPFFGDNADDAKLAAQIGKNALCGAYLAGIAEAWRLSAPTASETVAEVASVDMAHWR